MDVLLQVLIGLAGGAVVAALMPEMQRASVSRSGRRRVRAMLAGLVGAVAAEYGLVLFDPSVRTDGLTTALAALAGALWLAGIVEVYSSRRRRGEDGESRTAEPLVAAASGAGARAAIPRIEDHAAVALDAGAGSA